MDSDAIAAVSLKRRTRRPAALQGGKPTGGATRKRRMSSAEREQDIVDKAVLFFAEFGFEGQTRELAKRLKVTQPLLYRYFPNKDALIERVYQDVFLGRWDATWESLVTDRTLPLKERLCRFYQLYAKAIVTYEWVRLFMFAGLKGLDFNSRYLDFLREKIFNKIIGELRAENGRPALADVPATELELEAIWSQQATLFYLGVRKWIYNMPVPDDLRPIIEMKVTLFLEGAAAILARETVAATGTGGMREPRRGRRSSAPASAGVRAR